MKRVVFLHGILPDSLPWRVCVKGILRLSPFWGYRMTGDDVKFTVCIPTLLSRLDCVFLCGSPHQKPSPTFSQIQDFEHRLQIHLHHLDAAHEDGSSAQVGSGTRALWFVAHGRCGWGWTQGKGHHGQGPEMRVRMLGGWGFLRSINIDISYWSLRTEVK